MPGRKRPVIAAHHAALKQYHRAERLRCELIAVDSAMRFNQRRLGADCEYAVVAGKFVLILWRKYNVALTDICVFCGKGHKHTERDGIVAAQCDPHQRVDVITPDGITLSARLGYYLKTRSSNAKS